MMNSNDLQLFPSSGDRVGLWGPGNHNLRGISLSVDQKIWICDEIIGGHSTAKLIASRFNLPLRSIYDYVKCRKTQGILYEKRGRPACLDKLSLDKLHEEFHDCNPNEYIVKHAIVEQHEETVCRRDPAKDRNTIKRISKRSIGRYYLKLSHDDLSAEQVLLNMFM